MSPLKTRTTKLLLLATLIVSGILAAATLAGAVGFYAAPLTANSFDDNEPRISGNNVVWPGYGGPGNTFEIMLFNGSTVTALTANDYDDYKPRVSGNNVVWFGYGGPGPSTEIFFFNGSTVATLTANSYNDYGPQISGNNVVWQADSGLAGTSEIYFFNGSTVTTLTANDYNDSDPYISGDSIVWQGTSGLGNTTEIFRARIDEVSPSNPAVIGSTPAKDVWTKDNTVFVSFAGAVDSSTGVDGFSVEWSGSSSTLPDTIKDLEESAASALSPAQPNGNRWFHLRTRDNAGNWTSTVHYGPFKIDTTKPIASMKAPASVSASGLTARFRVSWSGRDAASRVKNYDVAYRIGKRGAWKRWKTGVSAIKGRFTAKTGKIYFFRARARDKAGNLGAWSKVRRTVVKAL